MNSRSKPTGPRKSGTRAKKPATIDLEAKEVAAAATASSESTAKASAVKSTSSVKSEGSSKTLGRAGAKSTSSKDGTGETSSKKEETGKVEPAKEQNKASPPPAAGAKSGGGFVSGLVGAAAAVAGLGAIGQYDGAKNIPIIGSLYSGGTEQAAQVDNSKVIAALSQEIEALKSANSSVDLNPINERLAQIEAAGSNGINDTTASRFAEIETSISGITETLTSIAKAAEDGESANSTELAAAISAVTQRLDALETNVGQIASSSSGVTEETSSRITGLEAKLEEMANASGTNLAPVETRIQEIETLLSSVKDAIGANSEAVSALTSQSSTLQETVASVKASEKVARSVAVNALGAALENDDPISLAIASIESLGGKTEETRRLSELAKEGIPTQKSLAAELATLTNTVQNPTADTSSGGISERFWANARNLVSFRSSGPREGNSPVAILSRIQASLENDDLSRVTAEWEKLPAEVRQSGDAWISRINKRIEAFALYDTLLNNVSAEAG